MALNLRSLVLLGCAPHTADTASSKLWWHASPDAAATVIAAGYYNDARSQLSVNDVIIANANVDGTNVLHLLTVTAVPTSGDITVAVDRLDIVA